MRRYIAGIVSGLATMEVKDPGIPVNIKTHKALGILQLSDEKSQKRLTLTTPAQITRRNDGFAMAGKWNFIVCGKM